MYVRKAKNCDNVGNRRTVMSKYQLSELNGMSFLFVIKNVSTANKYYIDAISIPFMTHPLEFEVPTVTRVKNYVRCYHMYTTHDAFAMTRNFRYNCLTRQNFAVFFCTSNSIVTQVLTKSCMPIKCFTQA